MSHRFVKRLALAAVVVGAVGLAAASSADARPVRRAGRPAASAFNLFAATTMSIEINRIYCGLRAIGEICVDVTGSPVLGGGSWPRGSGNAYIFNSGLQVAGVISPSAPFAWAGDTVGSWFMDPRGDQQSGEGVTDIYSSLSAADMAAWPSAAGILDTALYNSNLIGRQTISQQDIWWRYWDGNPNQTAGRGHPAGILVEQRGLGWNFPSGNEDILYFITRFINVTADGSTVAGRAKYDGLSRFGYTTAQIDEIAALGTRFQQLSEAKFAIDIPDTGYAIEQVFAAVMMDPDVGTVVTDNFSTANLVFSLAFAYVGDFDESSWQYPANINGAPFANAPGFVGVKYLQTPKNPSTGFEFGISMFSNTTNGPPFNDAVGIQQLYRYLSGTASPASGDNSCTVANPQQDRLCALVQVAADTRFFAASGPFTLNAGDGDVFVTAYVMAAPLAAPLAGYGPANLLPPDIPPQPTRLATGADTARTIDRVTGWLSSNDLGARPGETVQSEVTVARRSLLDKSLVAQAVFDNGFLLPFAPEAPDFYLLAGDNRVTVVWEASRTETDGDPYYAVASQATVPAPDPLDPPVPNPLYDPNYRNQDVEGYRIWRGRTPSQMVVIAQYDYDNTAFEDKAGLLVNQDYGSQCAPDLGVTASCPVDFGAGESNFVPIATQEGFQPGLVQVAPGGRVVTQAGNVVVTDADTAVSGGAHCAGARCPDLTDTGVPFAFVDSTVRNGFQYFYAVTAFDVNSVTSVGKGNTSLESPLVTHRITPRAVGGNQVPAAVTVALIGAAGQALDQQADLPTIDASGRFSGPMPPTNMFNVDAVIFSDQLLKAGVASVTIDSIVPEWYHWATYYITAAGVSTQQVVRGPSGSLGEEDGVDRYVFSASLPSDSLLADSLGVSRIPFAGAMQATLTQGAVTFASASADWHVTADGGFFEAMDPPASNIGGSRWFDGANETMADPTLGDVGFGQLTGVTTIYSPVPYTTSSALMRRFNQTLYHVFRAADIKIYWGATAGTVDSVIDVTHQVPVPFDPQYRGSYGFRNDITGAAAGSAANGVVNYNDFLFGACLPFASGVGQTGCDTRDLVTAAVLENVDVNGDLASDGTGFGLYINGEAFIFQAAALPSSAVWTYRSYMGLVDQGGSGGSYRFVSRSRPASVTGLRAAVTVTAPANYAPTTAANLDRVHTVPDPYYVTNALEFSGTSKVLQFVNLPNQAIIRIYSASGILVNVLSHNDVSGGGALHWNLRNRNNQFVASGVYFFHIETPDGQEKVGRFTVVNYAQ